MSAPSALPPPVLLPEAPDAWSITTGAGVPTWTRRAAATDLTAVNALHARASLDSRFARYHSGRRTLKAAEWARWVDPARGMTWVTHTPAEPTDLIAVVQLLHTENAGVDELGLLIDDAHQGQRLGTELTRRVLAAAAARPSCRAVTVMTGATNVRMLSILRGLGATIPRLWGPTIHVTLPLDCG